MSPFLGFVLALAGWAAVLVTMAYIFPSSWASLLIKEQGYDETDVVVRTSLVEEGDRPWAKGSWAVYGTGWEQYGPYTYT